MAKRKRSIVRKEGQLWRCNRRSKGNYTVGKKPGLYMITKIGDGWEGHTLREVKINKNDKAEFCGEPFNIFGEMTTFNNLWEFVAQSEDDLVARPHIQTCTFCSKSDIVIALVKPPREISTCKWCDSGY